jgi:hypothetical protein
MNNLKTIIVATNLLFILTSSSCRKSGCNESPKKDCFCTMIYDPVCGCNDKTYGNGCEAECNGIKEYTKGECPSK